MNSLLPPNQTPFEAAFCKATIAPQIPNGLDKIWSHEFCPENFLPWLAWGLSVDVWNSEMDISTKRRAIKNSPEIHRRKGTARAVKDVVAAFGGAIILQEWWETTPRGIPGTFTMFLSLPNVAAAPTQAFLDSVILAVNAAKPESAHFTFTLAHGGFSKFGIITIGHLVQFTRFEAVLKPDGGANLTYLTDQFGHFLTDQFGTLLIEAQ